MTNDEIKPFADKVLLYLYEQPDEERYHYHLTILDMLKLEHSLSKHILDLLWHEDPKKIEVTNGLADPNLRLSPYGREYAKKLNPPKMTDIEEACEKIFQLHITNHSIHWTKDDYHSIQHSSEALPLMIDAGVIKSEPQGNSIRTRLAFPIRNANSFEEALKMLEEKNKPLSSTHISEQYNFPHTQGTAIGKVSSFQNEIKTVQTTPKKERSWKDILKEEVIKHGVRYLFTALIFFTTGLITGKGCSRADHQDKNIQSNSIKKDSVLSNQNAYRH